ncbi:MAG TPA: hypothetical protein VGO67_14800 [Verrucomicrobiae bacterium]
MTIVKLRLDYLASPPLWLGKVIGPGSDDTSTGGAALYGSERLWL